MIALVAARGNTTLESAVSLTKELRVSIQNVGQRSARAASAHEHQKEISSRNKAAFDAAHEDELKLINLDIVKLLSRLEEAIPLINLALTTSGAKLSTQLPSTVSPSRLLQASTFLTAGDTSYRYSPMKAAQIGPSFTLSVYMLFEGHDRPQSEEDVRNTTWKEVIHKARVKLRRVPLDLLNSIDVDSTDSQSALIISPTKGGINSSHIRAENRADEFSYQILIVEDYDDDRHHDFESEEAKPGPFDDVVNAGIREAIPIHEVSKIFYADTSKVLNIGMDAESNHPVLLLRRDVDAPGPRQMLDPTTLQNSSSEFGTPSDGTRANGTSGQHRSDPWQFPPSLDPEWIAFEVYEEPSDSEDEDEEADLSQGTTPSNGHQPDLATSMSQLNVETPNETSSEMNQFQQRRTVAPQIKTSLSMLEVLLRLTSLQQFQQQSHLSVPDELLNFFLEESASTGAGGDEQHRQAVRADARRRVGFDPYDESPIKRRGEDYQYHNDSYSPRSPYGYSSPFARGHLTSTPKSRSNTPQIRKQSTQTPINSPSQLQSPSARTNSNTLADIPPLSRPEWLKQAQHSSRNSPLSKIHSDEGIGSSPAGDIDHRLSVKPP